MRPNRAEYLNLLQERDRRRQLQGRPTALYERTAKQELQAAMVGGSARHCLAFGGSRSGKTFGFCQLVAQRALEAPESRHLIARLHNIDVRQSVMLDTWPKMMRVCYPDVPYQVNKSDQYAVMPDGSEVWFGGLDDKDRVDKILGKEFATIYPNEASQVAFETVVTLRSRLAQACRRRDGSLLPLKGFYDLNPTGRGHWTYQEFIEMVRPSDRAPLDRGSRAHLVMNPHENPHLPAEYLAELDDMPERHRMRFRDGKYLTEVPGALWPMSCIEALRVSKLPPLARIVIGVDPSGSDGAGGDCQGIVVVALGDDGHGYVLADLSCRLSPSGWAGVVAKAANYFGADKVVAEANYGGAMVESTLRGAESNLPVKLVNASRGKHIRAEPVAALYEQGKAHHVGAYPELEEQMGMFTTAGYQGGGSPDRADALVWAFTELMLAKQGHKFAFA
ncbi:MAG: phage terminase large subunit [Novosphingobium aromaticivorans]|nr:phage terminase large subunit [Novosphingobium aromaticivorans]